MKVSLQLSTRSFLKTHVLFRQEGTGEPGRRFWKWIECKQKSDICYTINCTLALSVGGTLGKKTELSPLLVLRDQVCASVEMTWILFQGRTSSNSGRKKTQPPQKNSDGCRQTKSGRRWRRILPLQIASGDVLHNVMISLFGITSDDRHRSWNSQLAEYKTATALMNDLRGCSRHVKSWVAGAS